jgi:LytS/YehU family sensor histidine kinase
MNVLLFDGCLRHEQALTPLEPLNYLGGFSFLPYSFLQRLQPFAENAIWHGLMHKQGHGHLEIALSVEEKILTCMITDNGIGRHKAAMHENKSVKKEKSMGLQITTERLALLNQDINEQSFFNIEDITDDEGNVAGTRVILKMHYKNMIEAFG